MRYFLGLLVAVIVFWYAMSGSNKPLLLGLGAASIAVTMFLSVRLDIVNRESSPYGRLVHFGLYWIWLFIEILKANWRVVQACLKADMDINPALVKVKTTCMSDLAKTTFANSITLTPGTVTLSVDGDKLLVHALYEEDAEPGAFDEMDRRSALAVDGAKR
ncbi:MAG: Na+/H+ antiporter subunit E [Pseudomonadota bacterium]